MKLFCSEILLSVASHEADGLGVREKKKKRKENTPSANVTKPPFLEGENTVLSRSSWVWMVKSLISSFPRSQSTLNK